MFISGTTQFLTLQLSCILGVVGNTGHKKSRGRSVRNPLFGIVLFDDDSGVEELFIATEGERLEYNSGLSQKW